MRINSEWVTRRMKRLLGKPASIGPVRQWVRKILPGNTRGSKPSEKASQHRDLVGGLPAALNVYEARSSIAAQPSRELMHDIFGPGGASSAPRIARKKDERHFKGADATSELPSADENEVFQPRIATMVEALPRSGPNSGEASGFSADLIQEIFEKKTLTNPRVKALLARHGTVDIRQLARDLQDFSSGLRHR